MLNPELILVRVEDGEVIQDTHKAYGTRTIADTAITRKLYPSAIPINGYLVVNTDEAVFTAPKSGLYQFQTCIDYKSQGTTVSRVDYLNKGEQKIFSKNTDLYITLVR